LYAQFSSSVGRGIARDANFNVFGVGDALLLLIGHAEVELIAVLFIERVLSRTAMSRASAARCCFDLSTVRQNLLLDMLKARGDFAIRSELSNTRKGFVALDCRVLRFVEGVLDCHTL